MLRNAQNTTTQTVLPNRDLGPSKRRARHSALPSVSRSLQSRPPQNNAATFRNQVARPNLPAAPSDQNQVRHGVQQSAAPGNKRHRQVRNQ